MMMTMMGDGSEDLYLTILNNYDLLKTKTVVESVKSIYACMMDGRVNVK